MKLFVTGDNHIGRKFDKYSIKECLVESRFTCLQNMIETAQASFLKGETSNGKD